VAELNAPISCFLFYEASGITFTRTPQNKNKEKVYILDGSTFNYEKRNIFPYNLGMNLRGLFPIEKWEIITKNLCAGIVGN
jgi:hypothetical protein